MTDLGLEELFYFHARGVQITYEVKRNTEKIISLSVNYMQIDNQIDGAFPRVNMQKLLSPKHENEPCLSLNIITLPSGTKGLVINTTVQLISPFDNHVLRRPTF